MLPVGPVNVRSVSRLRPVFRADGQSVLKRRSVQLRAVWVENGLRSSDQRVAGKGAGDPCAVDRTDEVYEPLMRERCA